MTDSQFNYSDQQMRSVKRSILIKFQDDIVSIDIVMTSQIIRPNVKIWRPTPPLSLEEGLA